MKHYLIILLFFLKVDAFTQLPLLNSLPSAAPTIFLDFDGHLVINTSWNYNGSIACNPSGLNNTQITEVFNRVAEDFRPFTVNVTTDSTKFLAAPVNKRTRILITTSYEWFGVAGGVAFIGSFVWGDDSPCFVFSSLHNYNVKNISEAVSHEAGHTLGLFHQSVYNASCELVTEYNPGSGFGETSWGPIMGVAYNRNLSTWYNGPSVGGCSALQDDRSIITQPGNGITLKSDDNDNTPATAAPLMVSGNSLTATGSFDQIDDADLFRLQLITPQRVALTAKPANVGIQNAGANSDIVLRLYNSSMTLLQSKNPADSVQATVDTLLSPGIYFFRVQPVTNNYAVTTYGMSGQYILTGATYPATTLPLQKIEISGKLIDNKHQIEWFIEADEKITTAVLEFSTNGLTFEKLSESNLIKGNFVYQPVTTQITSVILYRLKVILENNKTFYSKTIPVRIEKEKFNPTVITNPVETGMIQVSGNSMFSYQILDLNGRLLKTGVLTGERTVINFNAHGKSIYIIRFIRPDGYHCSEKIMML